MGNNRKPERPALTRGALHPAGWPLAAAIRHWTLYFLILTAIPGICGSTSTNSKAPLPNGSDILPTKTAGSATVAKKLWEKQSYLLMGLVGYREVRETDLFSIRQFNPTGPDMLLQQEMELTTRHGLYPILTTGGAIHRNMPIYTRKALALHAHLSASLFYQKIMLHSTLDNPTMTGDNYPVHHFNMPSITSFSVAGGVWVNQLISAGVELNITSLRIKTADDRIMQKETTLSRFGMHPYLQCWIPLEQTRMRRWSARATASISPPSLSNHPYWIPAAEIALFRLSKQRTGRATGLFVRFLSQPEAAPEEYPDYQIHRDIQVLAGITLGTGGHNRRGGR